MSGISEESTGAFQRRVVPSSETIVGPFPEMQMASMLSVPVFESTKFIFSESDSI